MDNCMCYASNCEIKSRCYRYTAIPSIRQSFSDFSQPKLRCDYFWSNDFSLKSIKLRAKKPKVAKSKVIEELNDNLLFWLEIRYAVAKIDKKIKLNIDRKNKKE